MPVGVRGGAMDTVRFWVGVVVVMSYPVGLLLYLPIHPFVAFWRRFGESCEVYRRSLRSPPEGCET